MIKKSDYNKQQTTALSNKQGSGSQNSHLPTQKERNTRIKKYEVLKAIVISRFVSIRCWYDVIVIQ